MEVSTAYVLGVCVWHRFMNNCRNDLLVMSKSEWVWLSSTDFNFLQEVEKLERQKKEAKDDKQKKDIEGKLSLKTLERDLTWAKYVREIS